MLKTFIKRTRSNQLAKNTLWMMLGQAARLPIQAVYFILIARSLGAHGYGTFVGITAYVAILAPYTGLGSGNILIKNASRDPKCFRYYWGKTIFLITTTGLLLVLVAYLLSTYVLPPSIPPALIVSVTLADLFFTRLLDVSAQAYQAFQRLARMSLLIVLPVFARLFAILLLLLTTHTPSPQQWGYYYLVSTMISAIIGIILVNKELGTPHYDKRIIFSEITEGIYFSISISSQNIYNDIDKTFLTRLSTMESAGIYAAAYRIIDVAFTPLRSLLYASYARFFQSGKSGIRGSIEFATKLFPYAAAYGLLSSLVLFLSAPILPYILGSEYAETVYALRWLSLLPFLKCIHYFAADTMTGAGYQGARSICQIITAVLNITLILWLIPTYSWKGAAWASLASDSFLCLTLWLCIFRLKSFESKTV